MLTVGMSLTLSSKSAEYFVSAATQCQSSAAVDVESQPAIQQSPDKFSQKPVIFILVERLLSPS
jgi:hypothetical protein